jgi:hypothetical protein
MSVITLSGFRGSDLRSARGERVSQKVRRKKEKMKGTGEERDERWHPVIGCRDSRKPAVVSFKGIFR